MIDRGKMKRVRIFAYTKVNLGDDLFIKILCERYNSSIFIIYAPKIYKKIFENINNLKVIPSDKIFNRAWGFICRKINRINDLDRKLSMDVDAIVQIGGSLFIQNNSWRNKFNLITKPKVIEGKEVFLLGANFGPYIDNEYYELHKELFRKYSDICFRDKYSFNKFKDLPNVRMADDIIFGIKEKYENGEKKNNNALISVIKPSLKSVDGYDDIYYKKMKEILERLIDDGMNVTLMSFCKGEGDEEAIQKIISIVDKKYKCKVSTYNYRGNLDEALKIIDNSKLLVSSRFHGMILGFLYNKHVLPVIYSDKMLNVIKDLKFRGDYTDIKNIEDFKVESIDFFSNKNKLDIEKAKKNSNNHFLKLDIFLNDDVK